MPDCWRFFRCLRILSFNGSLKIPLPVIENHELQPLRRSIYSVLSPQTAAMFMLGRKNTENVISITFF